MLDDLMRRLLRPNPTRAEVPGHPPGVPPGELDVAPVRVTCHLHKVCLYRGDALPAGGGYAVAAAAGCPAWDGDEGPADGEGGVFGPWADCEVAAFYGEHGGPVFDHVDPTAAPTADSPATAPPADVSSRRGANPDLRDLHEP